MTQPGPVRGIRFIHQALVKDARDIERRAWGLVPDQDPADLERRVAWLARVVHVHTRGEEVSLFADLEERARDVAPGYLFDHRDEESLLVEVQDLARRLAAATSDAERAEVLPRLRRQTAVVSEQMHRHVRKEEELIVPLVERLFTPAEQGAHLGRMMAEIPPPDLRRALPWLVGWLDPDDRVAYVAMASQGMPPERFAVVAAWLREDLPGEVWSAVSARVPALSSV